MICNKTRLNICLLSSSITAEGVFDAKYIGAVPAADVKGQDIVEQCLQDVKVSSFRFDESNLCGLVAKPRSGFDRCAKISAHSPTC